MRIYKYPLPSIGELRIDMPRGATILTVAMQGDVPCLWAEIDPAEEKETRVFRVYGTGLDHDPSPQRYVGTFQVYGGALVWHLYEELGG